MDDCLDIIRKTLKQIKDSDIEVFLHFNPEVAVQIVNDLIDEPTINMMNGGNNPSNAQGTSNSMS